MSTKSQDEDLLTSHNYDGIQEYDNPMPGWWTFIFLTNIAWAAVYFVGINIGMIPTYQDDLKVDMAEQRALEAKAVQDRPPLTPEMLAEAAGKEEVVLAGASVYAMNCAACHGKAGEGLIGPNLTDNAWLYGAGDVAGIHDVVAKGTSKGMPGWSAILSQDELVGVIAYVKSLAGSNPPNPKAPEGNVAAAEGAPSDG